MASEHQLRIAYSKTGLLRLVAHRDMSTHLRRMFLRADLPMAYSEGFSPRPKFHFGPPLPLGVTCSEDWIDIELTEAVPPEVFLARVVPQCIQGLRLERVLVRRPEDPPLQDILQYAAWTLTPYEEGQGWLERIEASLARDELILEKTNRRGRTRRVNILPRVLECARKGPALRLVFGASPSAEEGPLGLMDFLRVTLGEVEDHPMTSLAIHREGFFQKVDGDLRPSISKDELEED